MDKTDLFYGLFYEPKLKLKTGLLLLELGVIDNFVTCGAIGELAIYGVFLYLYLIISISD